MAFWSLVRSRSEIGDADPGADPWTLELRPFGIMGRKLSNSSSGVVSSTCVFDIVCKGTVPSREISGNMDLFMSLFGRSVDGEGLFECECVGELSSSLLAAVSILLSERDALNEEVASRLGFKSLVISLPELLPSGLDWETSQRVSHEATPVCMPSYKNKTNHVNSTFKRKEK